MPRLNLADVLMQQKSPYSTRGDYGLDSVGGYPIAPYYDPRQTDYDYQSYVNAYGIPDQSAGQHLTDEFKLPNHFTFSTHSRYSNPQMQGGTWTGMGDNSNQWQFEPSAQNLKQHSLADLIDYFNNYERKGTKLRYGGKIMAEGSK